MTVARYAHFSDEDINNSFMPRRAVADHEAGSPARLPFRSAKNSARG
jgi:hypothetical protein